MKFAVVLAAMLLSPPGLAATQVVPAAVHAAAWLKGCWSADGEAPGSVEHWLAPAGGTMLGVSRTVQSGRTVAFEFMRIMTTSTGTLAFVAWPSGQNETTFMLSSIADGHLVFENLAHDFPQRISYRSVRDGKLVARIEGMRSGTVKSLEYPMNRVPCDDQQTADAAVASPSNHQEDR